MKIHLVVNGEDLHLNCEPHENLRTTMAWIVRVFTGWPALAPSRSTTCSHAAPS